MLRIEPLNHNNDQAASAILELVDGPRDMRFAMTAKTLVRERQSETGIRDITARNVAKVTRFREGGEGELERTVRRLERDAGVGKEGEGEEREAWERFPGFRERKGEGDEESGTKSWQEMRDERRKKRDPNTGRRGKMALKS